MQKREEGEGKEEAREEGQEGTEDWEEKTVGKKVGVMPFLFLCKTKAHGGGSRVCGKAKVCPQEGARKMLRLAQPKSTLYLSQNQAGRRRFAWPQACSRAAEGGRYGRGGDRRGPDPGAGTRAHAGSARVSP